MRQSISLTKLLADLGSAEGWQGSLRKAGTAPSSDQTSPVKVRARTLQKLFEAPLQWPTPLPCLEAYIAGSGGGIGWAPQEDLGLLCRVVKRDADILFQLTQAAHCQLPLLLDLLCSRQTLQEVAMSVAYNYEKRFPASSDRVRWEKLDRLAICEDMWLCVCIDCLCSQ